MSVLTSDPEISMHVFGGGREAGLMHLFCFRGFEIGFHVNRPADAVLPTPGGQSRQEDGAAVHRITHIGTPVTDANRILVMDQSGAIAKDDRGMPRIDRDKQKRGAHFVTGITWDDFQAGARTNFPNREVQDAMVALWPALLAALLGEITRRATGRSQADIVAEFSAEMQDAFSSGALIAMQSSASTET